MSENVAKRGDHLRVRRGMVDHHGIYAMDGTVVEFTKRYGPPIIKTSPLSEFASGQQVFRIEHKECLPADEVIERAHSRIGSRDYSLFENNCEHFAMWCKTGKAVSLQVEKVREIAIKVLEVTSKALEEYQRQLAARQLEAKPAPAPTHGTTRPQLPAMNRVTQSVQNPTGSP